MKNLRPFVCFVLSVWSVVPSVSAQHIRFASPNLAEDGTLLFKAAHAGDDAVAGARTSAAKTAAVEAAQGQVFLSNLNNLSLRQITSYPEKIEPLDAGKTLLVQNLYGTQLIASEKGGLPRAVHGFPVFHGAGFSDHLSPSPGGKWLLQKAAPGASSPQHGVDLVLSPLGGGEKRIAARNVENRGGAFPAKWSRADGGESTLFIYEKNSRLYFYTVNTESPPPEDERWRYIGEGSINSIDWTQGGFFYLSGRIVYRVLLSGLFARSPYAEFMEAGEAAAILPFDFDPELDSVSASPDGTAIAVVKNRLSVFRIECAPAKKPVKKTDKVEIKPAPLLNAAPGSDISILWSAGSATVLVKKEKTFAYRAAPGGAAFVSLGEFPWDGACAPLAGNRAVAWGRGGAALYDVQNWKPVLDLAQGNVLSCAFSGPDEIFVGGSSLIEKIRISPEGSSAPQIIRREIVCLSQADIYGFEKMSATGSAANKNGITTGTKTENKTEIKPRIFARSGGKWYATDGASPWAAYSGVPELAAPTVASSHFRAYLEERKHGFFDNIPMVRDLKRDGSYALLEITKLPATKKKAALCFDLYDDDEGLYRTLKLLDRYGFRATFFLSGEVVRTRPFAAREIAASGNEAASLFYASADLSDSRYRIGRDFIVQGLARNEDEYFRATGKELALLWHAPFYYESPEIKSAAASAGYKTVARTFDPGDWLTPEDEWRTGATRASASEMVADILKSITDGAIIPIRIGRISGVKSCLFNRIDALLEALVLAGYEIVPVSELVVY